MGIGNGRIIEIFGISESTAKVHIASIFKKLNVAARAAVAAL
jgi:DNA-binding CsgD family transcriptional regulator